MGPAVRAERLSRATHPHALHGDDVDPLPGFVPFFSGRELRPVRETHAWERARQDDTRRRGRR